MEHGNGKPSSALSDAVDYSRVLRNGVPRDVLESLLGEHDQAKQEEITSLRRQVVELSAVREHGRNASTGTNDVSDIRSDVAQLRQELATAMSSLRVLLAEGDGDLHEMQLTSLRRQVSQLEGVLESNYQRELRVAEDRETALRAEMAQMRQDLRVALETLYRMPAEADGSIRSDEFENLQKQVAELGTSLVHASNEQQRAALERENSLKTELAQMRRDLLVTLEASYQLPTDRKDGLDAQIASWRGQVEELQVVILGMREAQDEGAAQHRLYLQNEMQRLGQQIQGTLEASTLQPEHEELLAQRAILTQLAERVDEQMSGANFHFEQLAEIVSGKSSALEAEFATLRASLSSTVDELASRLDGAQESPGPAAIEALHHNLTELQSSLTSRTDSEVAVLEERLQAFAAALDEDLASFRAEMHSATESLSGERAGSFGEDERAILIGLEQRLAQNGPETESWDERELTLKEELATLQREIAAMAEVISVAGMGQVDHSTDLKALRHELGTLAREVTQTREEQQSLLQAHRHAFHEALAASQGVLLEASIARRDATPEETPLTAEAIGETISTRLGELHSRWNEAQTDRYRQLISQVSEVQSDLDTMSTGMQALQPLDIDESDLGSPLLKRVQALLETVQTHEIDRENSASIDEFNRLRYEIQELRSDLQMRLQSEATVAPGAVGGTPDFTLDDVVRVMATQLHAGTAEGDRLAANRDNVLRHELSQIRQDVQNAVQQLRASMSSGETSGAVVDFSELQADFADIRAGLARIPDSHDSELRGELVRLRQDLHSAIDSLRAADLPDASQIPHTESPLAERVAELELVLQTGQEDQRKWLEERDASLLTQLGDIRSSLMSAVADSQAPPHDASNDAWHEELTQIRSEIAALARASETHDAPDDSAVVDLVVALRTEMLQALDGIHASNSVDLTALSEAPAIQDGLASLTASLQQSSADQERIVATQHQTLQAAISQMREEMRSALNGLTRESVDTFETRQNQLRRDQLEMERNLAQLRQALVATQADPGNKKKLWR